MFTVFTVFLLFMNVFYRDKRFLVVKNHYGRIPKNGMEFFS